MGFDKADRCWTHSLFEEASPAEKNLYLYKLHGSIDWMWESETGRLTFSDSSSTIKVEDGALIFGTSYKLQYVDPFLFLVYQLRRFSLEAKLILVIGYGFCDEHINGILHQALRASPEKRLVAVMRENDVLASDKDKAIERYKRFVIDQLKLEQHDDRINIIWDSARDFLGEQLSLAAMSVYFPLEQEIFEDISAEVTPTSETMSAREPAAAGE